MDRFQTLAEIRAAFVRRLPLIVVLTLLGCVAAVVVALQQEKTYQTTAVVQIEDAGVPQELAGATVELGQSARRVQLIEQRLMARENLLAIMDKYGLFDEDPNRPVSERIAMMRESAWISEIRDRGAGAGADAPSGLYITVRLGDPEKAALVANELMHSVIDQSRERGASRARNTLEFFISEENRVLSEIERAESALASFKRDNADILPEGLADLRSQMTDLRAAALEIDREIVTLQSNTDRQRETVQQRQFALLEEQRALLRARIAELEAQIASAPEVERELSRLERDVAQFQDQYTVITRRKTEAELGQVLEDRQQTDRFEVLETALVPEQPTSRSRRELAMLGGVASFMLAVAVAAVVELMNPTIRTVGHMERALGVSPVIAIPRLSGRPARQARAARAAGRPAAPWRRRLSALMSRNRLDPSGAR